MAKRKAASVHVLDCPSCGGTLKVVDRALRCVQCGSEPDFPSPAGGKPADFAPLFNRHEAALKQAVTAHHCSECGADVAVMGGRKVQACEFCGSTHMVVAKVVPGHFQVDAAVAPQMSLADATALIERLVGAADSFLRQKAKWRGARLATLGSVSRFAIPAYEFKPRFRARDGVVYESDGLLAVATLYGVRMNWERLVRVYQKAGANPKADIAPLVLFNLQPANRSPEKAWAKVGPRLERLRKALGAQLAADGPSRTIMGLVDVGFRLVLLPFYVAPLRRGPATYWLIMEAVGGRLFLVQPSGAVAWKLIEYEGPDEEHDFIRQLARVMQPLRPLRLAEGLRMSPLLAGSFICLLLGMVMAAMGASIKLAPLLLGGVALIAIAAVYFMWVMATAQRPSDD